MTVRLQHDYAIPYTAGRSGTRTLDVHRPEGASCLPVIVWLHGGGWAAGHSRDAEEIRLWPWAERHHVVVSVNYRLTGEATHPTQLQDVRAALTWVSRHAREIGGLESHIFLAGASAGGHLAAATALTAQQRLFDQPPLPYGIRGVLPYYLVLDPLRWDREVASSPQPAPDTFSGRLALRRGSWPPPPRGRELLGPKQGALPSAVLTDLDAGPSTPPFLILHGSNDSCVDVGHSRDLYEWLRRRGVDATLLLIGDADHGVARFHTGPALALATAFVSEHVA